MGLAVVRSLDAPRRLATPGAGGLRAGAGRPVPARGGGRGDRRAAVGGDRAVIFEFIRFTGRPVWTARPADADRFLAHQRRELGRARLTVQKKAWALAHFFDFLVMRYQGDIHALTGHVVEQVIDEYNRPARADYGALRIRLPMPRWTSCSARGGTTCRRRASSCPRPGTTWPPRCGGGPGCGSPRPTCSTSGTGGGTWASTARSTCGSARAAGAAARVYAAESSC